MRTTFHTRQPYAARFLQCAEDFVCNSPIKPERFMEKMRKNQGNVGAFGTGLDEDGLERKNPVIVAMGDSVTAGHFESLIPEDKKEAQSILQAAMTGDFSNPIIEKYKWKSPNTDLKRGGSIPIEITDARESYIEKFREKLIDHYEFTSVSVINAGIAGDNLISMEKRMQRDIIRYQPDLVLINGSLNWSIELGSTEQYKEILRGMVQKIKAETDADIILLTPNGDLKSTLFGQEGPEPTTSERAEAIRRLAKEEQVCLSDTYAVWENARDLGIPWEELLANKINHPSVEGHEVYARVLMKLFQ